MKHLSYIIIGVAVGAALAFVAGSIGTHWYSEHLARSDDDINLAVKVFLVLWPLLAAAGGYLGHWLHRRRLTRPSREH